MITSISTLISKYWGKNNSSLTKDDLLKIQYSPQVVLGDLTKFIILFLIFLSLSVILINIFDLISNSSCTGLYGEPDYPEELLK